MEGLGPIPGGWGTRGDRRAGVGTARPPCPAAVSFSICSPLKAPLFSMPQAPSVSPESPGELWLSGWTGRLARAFLGAAGLPFMLSFQRSLSP